MGLQAEIESRTAAIQAVLDSTNAALTVKGGNAAANLAGVAAAISALPAGGGGAQIAERTITSEAPIRVSFSGGAGHIEVWGWGQFGTGFITSPYIFLGREYATYIGETPPNAMDVTIDASGTINGLPRIDTGKLLIVRR